MSSVLLKDFDAWSRYQALATHLLYSLVETFQAGEAAKPCLRQKYRATRSLGRYLKVQSQPSF